MQKFYANEFLTEKRPYPEIVKDLLDTSTKVWMMLAPWFEILETSTKMYPKESSWSMRVDLISFNMAVYNASVPF